MKNITIRTKIILLLTIAPLCFLLDQLTKWLVFKDNETFIQWLVKFGTAVQHYKYIEIFPFFNIVEIWNFGISFGLFSQNNDYGHLFLIAIAIIICLVFLIWMFYANEKLIIFAIPILIGGALGNIWDRLRFQAVADFLDFHAFGWHYPSFNLADTFVFIAIALIVFDGLFLERKRDSANQEKNNND